MEKMKNITVKELKKYLNNFNDDLEIQSFNIFRLFNSTEIDIRFLEKIPNNGDEKNNEKQ